MGIQLYIPHQSMLDAGFTHSILDDVYPTEDGGFEVIQSGLYSHPTKGEFFSYAVDHYYWDSNLWGPNRDLQVAAGLTELPGAEFI